MQLRYCMEKKVYVVPFICRAEYISQTGRCINNCLREHKNDAKPKCSIAVHAKECLKAHFRLQQHTYHWRMPASPWTWNHWGLPHPKSEKHHFIGILNLVEMRNAILKMRPWHTSSLEQVTSLFPPFTLVLPLAPFLCRFLTPFHYLDRTVKNCYVWIKRCC